MIVLMAFYKTFLNLYFSISINQINSCHYHLHYKIEKKLDLFFSTIVLPETVFVKLVYNLECF